MPDYNDADQAVLDVTPPEEEEEAEPTADCPECGANYVGFYAEEDARECCRVECEQCGASHRNAYEADDCCPNYECGSCGAEYRDHEDAESCCSTSGDYVPSLSEIEHHQITVPVIEGRPARVCSLEQELASGARNIATLLYEEQVTRYDHVLNYHSSGSQSSPGEVHVEEDGSLPSGGGEVVYDRFDLSLISHTSTFSRIVGKIRQLRDEHSLVKTSYAAGIHVHISAEDVNGECLSVRDITALYELWNYAEDLLYAISAAGWNRHRQPNDNYSGYCKAVPKVEGDATPAKVWRAMRSDRYYGLNFQRLFSAASNCSCGAGEMGDWNDCSCGSMSRATVEWRVFNASTLPRTIHAWIVLAQAMTAYAMSHEVGTLPVNEYGSQTASEKREVLDHLLEILPLTEAEKALISDAADRSPGL